MLFGDIVCLYKEACRHAAHRTFFADDLSVYENLEKEEVKLEQKEKYTDKEDIHTDEEVITSAIYNSVMNNKASNVLTSDSHLIKLIAGSLKHFRDYRQVSDVSEKLQKNPVRVYYLQENHMAQCAI